MVILALLPMGRLFSQIEADTSDHPGIVAVVAEGVVPCVPNKMIIGFVYSTQDTSEYSCRQRLIGLIDHSYKLLMENGIDTSLFNNSAQVFKTISDKYASSLGTDSAKKFYYKGGLVLISEGIYNKDLLMKVHEIVSKDTNVITFNVFFTLTKEQDDSLMLVATAKATESARREAEQLARLSNSKIIGIKGITKLTRNSYQFDFSSGEGKAFSSNVERNGAEVTFSPKPFDYSQRVYIDYYIESK